MSTLKDKIVEVLDRVAWFLRRLGHTHKRGRDAAKYVAAEIVKKEENLTDRRLAVYLINNEIGRMVGFTKEVSYSMFSLMRSRLGPEVYEWAYNALVYELFKGKQLRLLVQDSTDVPAYSPLDKDAKWGHRTPSRKEQLMHAKETKKELFLGYKPHAIVDVETEIPIAVRVMPANRNDKKMFLPLYREVRNTYDVQYLAKYIADSQYDAWDVKATLREDKIIPVIAINGRGHYESETPKDRDYGKRWAIEHVFSRLKEVFGMARNRFVGMEKVKIHIFSCLLAYILRYAKW